MKKFVIFSIYAVLICLSSGESAGGPPPEPHVPTTPVPEPTTTTPAPVPTTTTPAPPPPTTTTTKKPTPAPTTPPPTTTTTTTTTTIAPTTTAAPVPSTTTKPTPKPQPEVGTWSLMYPDTNNSCLILKMALEIEVHYERTDKLLGNATIILSNKAHFSGSCNNDTQQITLMLNENDTDSFVIFNFGKNATLKKFMLTSAEVHFTPTEALFPKMKSNATIMGKHDSDEFLTPLQMSYRCKPKNDYNLTTTNNTVLGKLIISNLQVEAFHTAAGMKFDSAKDCEASETPGIVPIAVGCSLAALIIIVLVAYLVGRRRSQARGYLSM